MENGNTQQPSPSTRVVRLDPPSLHTSTILKKSACVRPMRERCFNISLEEIPKKKIVNCYGMGGSGWTTLFGSVGKAIRLLEDKSNPIRVIGAGCMGLTAAIELVRQGYKVTGITAKELYDIASWRAGGYFAFVSLLTSPEEQANLDAIGFETFYAFRSIYEGSHPYLSRDCLRFLPVYGSSRTDIGLDTLEKEGLLPPSENVILDFGAIQHPGYTAHMTYFLDTVMIMKQLGAEVKRLGIPIEIQEVHSWDEIAEETIFNCSGLGGRELNKDSAIIPVRGHLLLLNDTAGKAHMDYIIYTTVEQSHQEEYIYLFPKSSSASSEIPDGFPCQGVLGGSFIPHTDKLTERELMELDEFEFEKMLSRSQRFFYGIK